MAVVIRLRLPVDHRSVVQELVSGHWEKQRCYRRPIPYHTRAAHTTTAIPITKMIAAAMSAGGKFHAETQ